MLSIAFAALIASSAPAAALAPLQRFTLIIGANSGGADRPRLQYAVSDAERFARVLVDLGGVSPANEIVLRQPRLRDLLDALDLLNKHVVDAKRAAPGGGRTEVVVYYSGHADEQGLLIGADRYSYRTLRDRLDQIPADVRIAILDACASGAFTRLKGGRVRPAFLVDESADMRGHAFLTSSAETEAAQESDRIRASYFTHYLISGFRGAADLSGDGRVTLNEAYQFAFNETLRRTVDTKGGAQHPSYDINLSGTGDVVMTDVRQTSATLVLGEDLEGRFFIRNAAHELVVELYKPRGRTVELGVEAGAYEVRIEQSKGSLLAKSQVAEGARVLLEPRQFGVAVAEATRTRGGPDTPAGLTVDGRHRIEARTGMWQMSGSSTLTVGSGSIDEVVGLQYIHYLSEDLAMTAGLQTAGVVIGTALGPAGSFSGVASIWALPVGVRWHPFRTHARGAFRPYVGASVGPAVGATQGVFEGTGTAFVGSHSQATLFSHFGLGLDYFPARSFAIGVSGGYNALADFRQPVGAQKNHSGPEVNFSFGWLFGKGHVPR
ncbi:MAG TPA: caspase family protein [Vicinamibacterales bacterium]|nr:caspase family protein [Vicinamibacterales bacterium]